MIITFATQKGGVGKTTLAIAFSNFLALNGNQVRVYDYDYQKSFYTKWQEDEILKKPKLYDVDIPAADALPFTDYAHLMAMRSDETIHLFDLAGSLDMKYLDILQHSDFVVIPFEYSDVSAKSTLIFINFLGLLESECEKIFVRSRYERNYAYPNQKLMDEELSRFGKILNNPSAKYNALQQITTRSLTGFHKSFKAVLEELSETIAEISGQDLKPNLKKSKSKKTEKTKE
ncbi:ParA family protein [Chryseobacterium taklimakanense]|uniref:ParA family protein n=1 Tax=Chryseobacterium taklimakanense TaxID=536441 RepID=A0A3G8WJ60_9FLAO|nr:ParA family protein [Chryseobacterium taklimakanense]AZI20609.1 ParA family protein [Chryseobacterium taklimakanense]